jgi:hypothetical protein
LGFGKQSYDQDHLVIERISPYEARLDTLRSISIGANNRSASGHWGALYYVIFTGLEKEGRTFPVASDLKAAREEAKFSSEKHAEEEVQIQIELEPPERLRSRRSPGVFLETKRARGLYGFWRSCLTHAERLLGLIPLDEITRSKMAEYKQLRFDEQITRRGKPAKGCHLRPSVIEN